jgi:catechol 2,3-dioxygenase-like lactoylglutathione lyase family enzyme
MGIRSFEHVGVIVRDLDAAASFFELLGMQRGDVAEVGGEWADRVNGLLGTQVRMVFLTAPDGSGALELSQFISPDRGLTPSALPSDELGLRHLAYRVESLRPLVEKIQDAGFSTVGDIVDYEGQWLVCYVRGPEGILVELGERLDV